MSIKDMSKKDKVNNKIKGLSTVDLRYTNAQALKEKTKDINNESDSPEFNNTKM